MFALTSSDSAPGSGTELENTNINTAGNHMYLESSLTKFLTSLDAQREVHREARFLGDPVERLDTH